MKKFKLILIALLLVAFTAPASFASEVKATWKKLVKDAKSQVMSIDSAELKKWIEAEKDFVLVDVREPDEEAAGYIDAPDSFGIPRGKLDPAVAKKGTLTPDQTVVIYCKAGSRGALSAKLLKDLGFDKVYNLDKGIVGWIQAGYPITNMMGTFVQAPKK